MDQIPYTLLKCGGNFGNKKKIRMKTFTIIIFLLLSTSAFSQEKQFNKSVKRNSIESYQKFIEKFPFSEYTESAEFKKSILIDTDSGYEYFLSKYPNGNYSEKVKEKLCVIEYSLKRQNLKILSKALRIF